MATDFFDRQAAARRSTGWLIAMFALAVVVTAVAVFAATWLAVSAAENTEAGSKALSAAQADWWQIPLGAALGTLVLIAGGSLFKVTILRAGGGRGVAESLAGRRLLHDTATEANQKRLLNVVDEMAIASGTPAPPVFLIDDPSINAFAAGYSPSDAVIGVTRGCVEQLSRDELQGVIAHEFSHILNGDMRMSIRLIGVLHGILLLGLIGQLLMRSVFYSSMSYSSRRSNNEGNNGGGVVIAVLVLGATLIAIGAIGTFFGGLIKAAVSRQREHLADASAVQFTRNPAGIAGALKRIMAATSGSAISHPRAAELSHMYFAQGVWEGFTSLMATHPPLRERILAIEPSWDGSLPKGQAASAAAAPTGAAGFAGGSGRSEFEVSIAALDAAVDQIGDPVQEHRAYAAELIGAIPSLVREAAGEPSGARAVVYGLLLDRDPEIRQKQRQALEETADPAVVRLLFERLVGAIDSTPDRARLPLIDLTLASLAAMSTPQYQRFCRSFRALVVADERLSLFEWTLSQIVLRHLQPHFEGVRSVRLKYRSLYPLSAECGVLLSVLARACGDKSHVEEAYAAGREVLGEAPPRVAPREACRLDDLRGALEKLATASATHRGRAVDAAAAVVCADGRVTVAEAELLRGVADLLDCPMPPLLPGQSVAS